MTIVVSITGGIGSGKSTFSKEILKRGIPLLDSDLVVANIYRKPNIEFIKYLKKIGLKKAINGTNIDKKYVSNIIFSDKAIKSKLEKFIFKIVRKGRERFIEKHKKKNTKIIFLDIPLLFENNLDKNFDIIISIISSKKERLKRLKKSKKITKIVFNKILKAQTSDVVRKEKSDIVIINNDSMKMYLKKINKLLDKKFL